MEEAISAAAAIAFVVLGLVELLKRVGPPRRVLPLLALACGLLCAFLVAWADIVAEVDMDRPGLVVLVGLIAGISASGIHSGVDAMTDKP